MSFRSPWRHAGKVSPMTPPSTPSTSDNKIENGVSEPTLVVTNSRPSSTHDGKNPTKNDKPTEEPAAQEPVEAAITERPPTSDGRAPDLQIDNNTTDVPKTTEGKGTEDSTESKKESINQDARWFSWWSGSKPDTTVLPSVTESEVVAEAERPKTAPEGSSATVIETITPVPPVEHGPVEQAPIEPVAIKSPPSVSESSNGSYLAWIWPTSSPAKSAPAQLNTPATSEPTTANKDITKPIEPSPANTSESTQPQFTKAPESSSSITTTNPLITTLPQTRSSWMSFWTRSDSMPDLKRTAGPETMQVPDDIDPQGRPVKKQKAQDDTPLNVPPSETNGSIKSKKGTHTPSVSTSNIPVTPSKPPATPTKPETPIKTPQKGKNGKDKANVPPPPNHVLPEFNTVYPSLPAKASFFSRVTKAILPVSSTHHLLSGALHPHSKRCPPPPIRKAVAIGIHGFFPLRILRSVLGEPTGTSVKFATLASEAIHRFSERQYGDPGAIEVVKIALEGEGTVAARINMLWKNLAKNTEWMDHIRDADLILVACHSQGSPVGAGIMARLVEEGIVGERTRLGLLCVAGIHLGPAMDVGQRVVIKAYNAIESEAARELYEFQDSDSKVSRKYVEALRTILAHDTRVTLIGSIDDHLVPMYSSTFSTAYHGSIYRAVFIDGRIHETDFLARLVAFALRLRNEGWRDHGVMTELSSALMGNFYTGEGHSRIYAEPAVYDLALRNTLETTSMKHMPLHIEPFKARTTPNPYLLPWSMRGVLEETIRGPLSYELEELKEEFARWDPKGPKLKDLKWRMEGWSIVKPKI